MECYELEYRTTRSIHLLLHLCQCPKPSVDGFGDMSPSKDVFAMATSADPGAGRCHAPITAAVAQEDLGSKPPLAWQDTNIAEGPDDYRKPTNVGCVSQLEEAVTWQQQSQGQEPGRLVGRWHRYATDESYTAFWWCCEDTGEGFLEAAPGPWSKYEDPRSGKTYWWRNNACWF